MKAFQQTAIGIVAGVAVFMAFPQTSAPAALQIANTFSIRDNVGPNTVGTPTGDRLVFGATDITPAGDPTVTATQGPTTVQLSFLPLAIFPNQYVANLPFDPALTGSWTLIATRGTETASAITNAIPHPKVVPLVNNLRVSAETGSLTPTLRWELPDLSGVTITRIRVRVIDAFNGNQLAQVSPLSPTATSVTIPVGTLAPTRAFVFRVMLDDVSEGFLQNRSNTFSAPYVLPPLSGTGTARIDGALSPGEWDNAGRLDFPVLLPAHDGGGTFTATLYVMNDATNLYLALRAPLVAVPDVLTLTFDNDNDRVFREGEDALGLFPATGFADWYFTTQPPCQPGFFCLVPDDWGGGTQNGIGVVATSGDHVVYEVAHPLNSGDRLDFALKAGDQVGFRVQYSITSLDPTCTTGCFAGRLYPVAGPAVISISAVLGPVANAGPDVAVAEGTAVALDGSASRGGDLAFEWTQLAGPAVSLTNPTAPVASFTAPPLPGRDAATLTFQLTVRNATGASSDTVDVRVANVNQPPLADAGELQTVREGAIVTLDGRNSFDPDGDALGYRWIQVAGPAVALNDAETATPSFSAPLLPGGIGGGELLTFRLSVSDGVLTASDDVQVGVVQDNHAPVADAGAPQTVRSRRLVTLDGRASYDPDGDPIGFQWAQVGGPAVELVNAMMASPTFTTPPVSQPTTLTFRLVVTDFALTGSADVAVTVANNQPVCERGRAVPDILWPPDHRMVRIDIAGVTDPDDDRVNLSIFGVTQDEPVNGGGDGDTSPDAVVSEGSLLLRAERSGRGNGRMYEVTFTADDGAGGRCTGVVRVGVPHSMKTWSAIIDDGQHYDSTRP
jgi:K319-like protein